MQQNWPKGGKICITLRCFSHTQNAKQLSFIYYSDMYEFSHWVPDTAVDGTGGRLPLRQLSVQGLRQIREQDAYNSIDR